MLLKHVTDYYAFLTGKFLRVLNTVKMSYAVMIGKSSMFGVFVALLVWKLQVSLSCLYILYVVYFFAHIETVNRSR